MSETLPTPKSMAASLETIDDSNGDMVWYLGYGSNMSSKVLSGRRNVHPAQAYPVIVPGYELTFDMAGLPYWEPGFGTIEPVGNSSGAGEECTAKDAAAEGRPLLSTSKHPATATSMPGNRVGGPLHCVAFQITRQELEHIVNTEGGSGNPDFGYRLVSIPCETYSGQPLVGMTLVNSQVIATGMRPSPRYHNILIEGAGEHGLAPEYVARLKTIEPFVAKTPGQKAAKYLMLVLVLPAMLPALAFGFAALAFDVKTPRVVAVYNEWVTRVMWSVHSWIIAPVFGKGC